MTAGRFAHSAVIGAGSWGTTFAKILADSAAHAGEDAAVKPPVRLWGRRSAVVDDVNTRHHNDAYLPGIELPATITASTDLPGVLHHADLVVLAVPSQSLRAQLPRIRELLPSRAVVVSLMKGLEHETRQRMSEVITAGLGLPAEQVAVVSGPNLAMEIARESPTASVVACVDEDVAAEVAAVCTPPYFRPYTNTDVVGVEFGGIVKNVIALAVGICEGRQMGDNAKASVITRGLAETTRLALALGGQSETMAGLAGLGDLVATCSSPLSRNHTAGRLLATGLKIDEVTAAMRQTAEGVKSARPVLELARSLEVRMPITENVVAVLDGEFSVDELAQRLLGRDLKSEGAQ